MVTGPEKDQERIVEIEEELRRLGEQIKAIRDFQRDFPLSEKL